MGRQLRELARRQQIETSRLVQVQQGPATGAVAGTGVAGPAVTGAATRVNQGPEVVETVGCDQASRNKFPDGQLDLGLEQPRCADEVGKKQRT